MQLLLQSRWDAFCARCKSILGEGHPKWPHDNATGPQEDAEKGISCHLVPLTSARVLGHHQIFIYEQPLAILDCWIQKTIE